MASRFSLGAFVRGGLLAASAAPALAAPCGTGTFEAWLEDFKKEAASKGISQPAIQAGLTGVTLDKAILARDHSQAVFNQTFEQFSGRMVPPRLARGSNMLKQYGSVLARLEHRYCGPAAALCAIWGPETDFRAHNGTFPAPPSLAAFA